MKITALALQGQRGWPALQWDCLTAGLNVCYGSPGSGKTTLAEFLAHALYGGRRPVAHADHAIAPEGEVIVDSRGGRYRLRRYDDGSYGPRLTVAAIDGGAADRDTVRHLLHGLSPTALVPLYAVSFQPPPHIGWLLSDQFAREFRAIGGGDVAPTDRRSAELATRRDALAGQLETQIADQRRISRELDERWQELERQIRQRQHELNTLQQRLRTVETALAETDARLRYRRLELNVELRWHAVEPFDWEPQLAELDEQIAHWRATLADLASREANVRARLAQVKPGEYDVVATLTDQRAWLAVARQLAADLEGEVARLARATASEQCVCRDAHPRLRPIVETVQRQLDALESLVGRHERATRAAELADEAEHLSRSQAELRGQLEHLLDRRQSLARSTRPSRRPAAQELVADDDDETSIDDPSTSQFDEGTERWFSAADAEQLEQRRIELEQERFDLVRRLPIHQRQVHDLRAEREATDRQRAALLSGREIDALQRELSVVQHELERAAYARHDDAPAPWWVVDPSTASDYLAQLTDGRLVSLQLIESGRHVRVVGRGGESIAYESLSAGERDSVYLSVCLALVSAAARHGVHLPLLLDEPFARLDARGIAALAVVLEEFGRQGHQVLVFTGEAAAAERLASFGVPVDDIASLRRRTDEHRPTTAALREPPLSVAATATSATPPRRRKSTVRPGSAKTRKGTRRKSDRSDAA